MAIKQFNVTFGGSGDVNRVTYGSATGGDTITTTMTGVSEIVVLVNDAATKADILKALEAVEAKLIQTNTK